ncbi:MAG TPA: TolC family protein [Bacteroidia bacterium]|nr:TolC family protein [Bacteroidia bacterium]
MKSRIIFFFFLLTCSSAFSQQVLTPENAIDRAMSNNFSIRIARNTSEIKNNDASAGNAGMLPQVDAAGAYTSSTNSTKQEYSNGTEINKDGAKQTILSAGVALDWVLFDGMKMFASYDKLKTLSEQGKIDLKIQMESVIEEVYKTYYGVVRETQLLKALEESFVFYQDRLSIAEKKYNIGSSSKLDFLQSKVDLNAQQAAILQQQENLINARTELNRLLVFPVDSNYTVADTIIINYNPDYASLKSNLTSNFQLQSIEKNISISRYTLNEIKGQRFPLISGNAGYLFSDNKNDAGFFVRNQNTGLQFGITARYNLFSGFNTSRQIRNAKLGLLNSELLFEQTTHTLNADLIIAFEHFKNSGSRLKLEEDNIGYARENASVYTESFRLGSANSLQVKQAQESLNIALARLIDARCDSKIAEIILMRLSGTLVK